MIEHDDGYVYLGIVIRSAAFLPRRVAGLPDRLARGLAVLALLVLAAVAAVTAPAPARATVVGGPSCAVASPRLAMLSGAQAPAPQASRSVFERTDLCAADCEIPGEVSLPRGPVAAPRARHTVSASFGYTSDAVPPFEPTGSPLRPPRSV